jgi:hypothetical protein
VCVSLVFVCVCLSLSLIVVGVCMCVFPIVSVPLKPKTKICVSIQFPSATIAFIHSSEINIIQFQNCIINRTCHLFSFFSSSLQNSSVIVFMFRSFKKYIHPSSPSPLPSHQKIIKNNMVVVTNSISLSLAI